MVVCTVDVISGLIHVVRICRGSLGDSMWQATHTTPDLWKVVHDDRSAGISGQESH